MAKQLFSPNTKGKKFKLASGDHTTVAAVDTVATGLSVVEGCVASLETDHAIANMAVTALKSATAGAITIKTWRATAAADCTPLAANAFSKKVNWLAWGY